MDLALVVDPAASDRFEGRVRISLELARRLRKLELHACELRIARASVVSGGQRRRARVVARPERETIEVVLAEALPAGPAELELEYSARFRSDLCGLYLAEADGRRFAFTQLAATHARRFVPCFDEPARKVRVRLAVTTAAGNTVLSNSPIESVSEAEGGTKTVRFAETPPLSTYLIALAVGELVASPTVACGATPITVWHVPGREGLTAFALEIAQESLGRLETWFDRPHPYAKLDLVAVPDFAFGAMENVGAVFFRETLLLVDRATASLDEQRRVAEVITHELAHMWYGNLVTMAWWDDLWLNEAFATWMAFEILESSRPEWCVWQSFQHRRAAALDADALASTHPIHTPVASADEAAENFDLITYEKGASVVRMLARHLGEETFRRGVRLYIERHREANAVAADLWQALGEVSGQRVDRLVRPWLEQAGHPVVTITRRQRKGLGVVELRQAPMRWTPRRSPGPARSVRRVAEPRWPIPMLGRIGTAASGTTREVGHLLTRACERIPASGADLTFLYGNAHESGFYRPDHAGDLLDDLIEEIDSLQPIERQGLVDHQWALVRAGLAPLAGLLALTARLGADRDPDVLAAASAPLASLCRRLAPDYAPQCEARLRAWVEVYYGGQVDELGFEPRSGEDPRCSLRRAEILRIVGVIGEATSVVEQASRRCRAYLADRRALAPDLADVVVAMAAMRGGAALYDELLGAMRKAPTPQERTRFLLSLADFRAPELIDRTLALCLVDEVGAQDLASVLIRMLENRHARERAWSFIRKRWPALRRRLPAQLGGRLIAATPALLTREHRREVAELFRTQPIPASERALRQALERFDWYAGFRKRVGPQLVAYWAG